MKFTLTLKVMAALGLILTGFPVQSGNSGWISITPLPYGRALRNPLKGFTGGNNPWRTLEMVYVEWNEIENDETDGFEKIRQYMEDRWASFPDSNIKVIPRVRLIRNHIGETFWPADMTTGDVTSDQFLTRVVRLIERLGVLWDNDPRIAFVEVGIIGRWGEHHDPAPSIAAQEAISDAFIRSFPNTRSSVRHPWREFEPGAFGVYWDSFAHEQQMWTNGNQIKGLLREDPEFWRRNYIGGEVAYDWGARHNSGLSPHHGRSPNESVGIEMHRNYVINTIRWLHATQLRWISNYNQNSDDNREGAEELQKAMGYRFVLEEAGFSTRAEENGEFSVELHIRNEGSAPFYYDWPLSVTLLDPQTLEPVWKSTFGGVDLRDWLPGSNWTEPDWQQISHWDPKNNRTDTWNDATWDSGTPGYASPPPVNHISGQFQADLPAGEYILAVSIPDPTGGNRPSVRFATANYLQGGRHPLGRIAFGEGQGGALPDTFSFSDPHTDDTLHYVLPAGTLLPDFQFEVSGSRFSRTVAFDAGASSAVNTEIVSYEWDFDNNGQIDATGPIVTHTYANAGSYAARLTVTDADGNTNTTTRRVRVPQRLTFGNQYEPWPLPGRVEAQHFDKGGQGVAYFDTTIGNAGNSTLRQGESVDIQTNQDVDGIYNIGWIAPGEWLEYTVEVAQSGLYRLDFRVASWNNTGEISVSIDGHPVGGVLNVPNTGGWQAYQTRSLDAVHLTAGPQTVRLTFPNGNVNFNWWAAALTAPDDTLPFDAAFPTDGLTGAWLFDKPAGDIAFDSSGFMRHGTLQNAVRTDGYFGNGLEFGAAGSRVTLPDFSVAGTELTLSAWIYWNGGATADARIFSKASSTNAADHILKLGPHTNGRLRARLKTNGVTRELFTPEQAVTVGAWHHVAMRYDGQALEIHVDGELSASAPVSGTVDAGDTIPAAIGNQPQGAGDRRFHGVIDHVLLYNRALNDEEMKALAGLTNPRRVFANWLRALPSAPSPEHRDPLDDPTGTGITNLLAFALGGDPMIPASVSRPSPVLLPSDSGPGYLGLTYHPAQPTLLYAVEATDSLDEPDWTPLGVLHGAPAENGSVTARVPLSETTRNLFMRLRITLPDSPQTEP
jgi:hypothetical protein